MQIGETRNKAGEGSPYPPRGSGRMWLPERHPSLSGRPRPPCLDDKEENPGERGATGSFSPLPTRGGQGPGPPSLAPPEARVSAASPGHGSAPPRHRHRDRDPAPPPRLTGCRLCGNIALAAAAALFPDNSILRSISNFNRAEEN